MGGQIRVKKKVSLQISSAIIFIILILLTTFILVPIYYLLITTLKTSTEAAITPLALPSSLSIERYITVFNKMHYPRAFFNTFCITSSAVIGIIIFTSMGGFVLQRKSHSMAGKIIFTFILAGLIFPFSMSMLGLYKVVQKIRLMNTLLVVILIDIAGGIPYATFIFKSFIGTVPFEMEESARIDGVGVICTFWCIIFPLLRPIVLTIAILDSFTIWNDFMIPLYFIQSGRFRVLLQEVYNNVGQFSTDWTNLFPMMVLAVLPLVIFYFFMQRFIIDGIMSGSLKG
jgi:raffinose/stachyose/melibiose transport system permease protein